ncbi:MAG: DUF2958 domain-containing protein [Alphaproteobacteria bacterium GM202ARS2]|nr:DUF2958 domain-containing protein [Alphaproteobacteria bacterium GM202ARS2]
MKLITKAIEAKLRQNGVASAEAIQVDGNTPDHTPVMKLFTPWGASTWLIKEMDEDGDTLFGLCDLGMGCPAMGPVSLAELRDLKVPFGLRIERDLHWSSDEPLTVHAARAREVARIVA